MLRPFLQEFSTRTNQIDEFENDKGEVIKVLPNGEVIILHTNRHDSRECTDYAFLSDQLGAIAIAKGNFRIRDEYSTGERKVSSEEFLYRSAFRHLRVFGYNHSDAKSWANSLVNGDHSIDRYFPRSFFLSLAANIRFSNPGQYQIQPPHYQTYIDGNNDQNLQSLLEELPPIKVGAALPVIGWYDDYGDIVRSEATLLRPAAGSIHPGKLSIPGGKTDDLLEITAWLEFQEEVAKLAHLKTGVPVDYYLEPHSVTYQTIVDQIIQLKNGSYARYQADIFRFDIALDTLAFIGTDHGEYNTWFHGENADGKGDWDIHTLSSVQELLQSDQSILSPLATRAFESFFDLGNFTE